jgi:hypothetical protein
VLKLGLLDDDAGGCSKNWTTQMARKKAWQMVEPRGLKKAHCSN